MDWSIIKRSKLLQFGIAVTFFTSGLIINAVQAVLYFTLRPVNKRLYKQLNYYCCYSIVAQCVFILDWWSNSKTIIYANKKEFDEFCGHEHALLLMNHTYEIDFLCGWAVCDKVCNLGNCKAYAKKAVQYIPTLGFAWRMADFVFLERSYEKDRKTIFRQVNEVMDYPSSSWLLLNAEGTRFTPSKHLASLKFAKEHGLPELKHHLLPRTKGFVASLAALKDKCPAIYDIQLAFKQDDPVEPTLLNLLNGRPVTAHSSIRRIPMSEVPTDDEAAAKWLLDLFIEKDAMMERFAKTGSFFAPGQDHGTDAFVMGATISCLLNTVCWTILCLVPMIYYLATLLLSGELMYFSIGAGIIGIFYWMMQKTIGMSQISKGSSYGASSKSS